MSWCKEESWMINGKDSLDFVIKNSVDTFIRINEFSSVQSLSCVQLFTTPAHDPSPLFGLQHARLPRPLQTPGTHSNSCPSSQWCHPTISSSVIPFFSLLQSFSASGSFPMSQFFTSGVQSIGVSQHQSFQWIFRIDFLYYWLVWSLCNLRDSQESSPTPQFKSISSSYQVAKVSELQLQHQSFQWIFRTDFL